MLLHLSLFAYSLVYLVGMEIVVSQEDWFSVIAWLLLFWTFRVARETSRSLALSVIPLIFAFSSILLLYLIDSDYQRQVFIGASTLAYYLALLGGYRLRYAPKDQTARGMLAFSSMMTLFFFFSATYGFYLNFAIPLWLLMLVYGLGSYGVSFPYFYVIQPDNPSLAQSYSLVLSLIMVEMAWVFNFWPFGYLTTGVVALICYYVLWDLTQSYFLNTLSQKRVLAHMAFLSMLVVMILASSRWLPVV